MNMSGWKEVGGRPGQGHSKGQQWLKKVLVFFQPTDSEQMFKGIELSDIMLQCY